jgi:multiple sugar transport system permease protein
VILADTALLLPFSLLVLRPFFRAIPVALEESARIDGASTVTTFWRVVLPLARNGAMTVGTLVFILSWGEFLYAINFLLNPTDYPLSVLMVEQISGYGINWGALMALAVVTSLPILVVFVFTYRRLREGLSVGAVK